MVGEKEIPQWKLDEVNELKKLFGQYNNVAVIEVASMNDRQVQEMRKTLRGDAVIKMSKKNLILRAIEEVIEESDKENLDKLAENIPGQSALCFTDMNVFALKRIFNENLWMVPAKPDEITPVDIWVPEGDTGLPTGQVISELNMTLRLPTRLQNDTIWIREATKTHKAGEFVNVKQAAVLKKLGITPIESLIKIHYAWSDGETYASNIIYMDLEAFQQDIASAFNTAKHIAVRFGIIDDYTIEPIIQRAHREALTLIFEAPIYIDDLRDHYIRKGVLNAQMINNMIFGSGVPPIKTESSTTTEEKDEEEEDEDEDEDEDEEVGIGGLFG